MLFFSDPFVSRFDFADARVVIVDIDKSKVSIFDFAHVSCLFLVRNDSKLSKVRDAHNKKLHNLELENRYECQDPDKVT